MSKNERIAGLLENIVLFCDRIKATVQRYGDDIDVFLKDLDYQSSVSLSLIQIGELAKRLPTEFREQNSIIPWGDICGLRDIVVHTYGKVDFNEIFETSHQNIDDLLKFCKDWLAQNSEL